MTIDRKIYITLIPSRQVPVQKGLLFLMRNAIKLLLLLSLCRFVFADTGFQHIQFRHLTVDSGLSHSKVYAAVEDKVGFLWFATAYGLNRYDGYEFKLFQYQPDNPHSLSGNYIWNLFRDSQDRIWVSTWGTGLNLYQPESESFIRFRHSKEDPNSLPSDNIWSVFEEATGPIWVSTEAGLSRLDIQGLLCGD